MAEFISTVVQFADECSSAAGESGDVKDVDVLKLACPLYAKLKLIQIPSGVKCAIDKDAASVDFGKLTVSCCDRLCSKINELGIKWLKEAMQNGMKGNAPDISSTICPPTPRLADAIVTCNLLEQTEKLEGFQSPAPGFAGLVDVISMYAMVSSIDKELMEAIAPETAVETCLCFQKRVDSHFKESVQTFLGNLTQLQTLNTKYACLGCLATHWSKSPQKLLISSPYLRFPLVWFGLVACVACFF